MNILIGLLTTLLWSSGYIATTPYCDKGNAVLELYAFKGEQKAKFNQWVLPNRTFSLSFLHSATLTPVKSHYKIEKGKIIHIGEEFETHGYGLPSSKDESDVISWTKKKDKFVLKMHRVLETMVVRISKEYQNTLYIDDKVMPLGTYDGKSLIFKVICDN